MKKEANNIRTAQQQQNNNGTVSRTVSTTVNSTVTAEQQPIIIP